MEGEMTKLWTLVIPVLLAGCADIPRPPLIPLPSPDYTVRPPLIPRPSPQAYYGHHVWHHHHGPHYRAVGWRDAP
jgi:hypothetical protein